MNISVSNIGWDKKNDDNTLESLSKLGVNYLEIAPSIIFEDLLNLKKSDITRFKDKIKRHNMRIVSFQSLFFQFKEVNIFSNPEKSLEILKILCDLSNELECKNLVFGSPKNRIIPDFNSSKYYDDSLKFFDKVGDYFSSMDTILSIEPNPKIYECNFLTTTQETYDYLVSLNNNSIKLNLDLGTVKENNEDLYSIFQKNISLINHIHISEPYLKPFKNFKMLNKLIRLVYEKRYKGFISLEMTQNNEFLKITNKIISEIDSFKSN